MSSPTFISSKFRSGAGRLLLRLSPQRHFYIQTEATPNPQSFKFLPGREVLPEKFGTGMQFDRLNKQEINRSPLAKKLFSIPEVKNVFLGKDFVSITKEQGKSWDKVKPEVFIKMMDFYDLEDPIVIDENYEAQVSDTTILESDSEIVATIKELLETKIRPSVQDDGGDIFFVGFDEYSGLVSVKLAGQSFYHFPIYVSWSLYFLISQFNFFLTGSCVGCPSSSVTLRQGVERMLMHYIPEVKGTLFSLLYFVSTIPHGVNKLCIPLFSGGFV